MGIDKFLQHASVRQAIRPTGRDKLIPLFGGKVAGIDASCFVHQIVHAVGDKYFLGEDGALERIVSFFMDIVFAIRECNIIPFVVFDGMRLPAKSATDRKRKE